jgi:hypothetical protein
MNLSFTDTLAARSDEATPCLSEVWALLTEIFDFCDRDFGYTLDPHQIVASSSFCGSTTMEAFLALNFFAALSLVVSSLADYFHFNIS